MMMPTLEPTLAPFHVIILKYEVRQRILKSLYLFFHPRMLEVDLMLHSLFYHFLRSHVSVPRFAISVLFSTTQPAENSCHGQKETHFPGVPGTRCRQDIDFTRDEKLKIPLLFELRG